ncbi:MAG: hypothetical protein PVF69_10560 [Gemmatimonadota bacterium]|jgi:hypothetical protein
MNAAVGAWIVLALLGAGVLAVSIINFLGGGDLFRDMLDKHRLRRRSLKEWDRAWGENDRESDIVVCLTTTPSRIHRIEDTLKSLMAQSLRPRRIRLHLPRYSLRERCFYNVPSELKELRSLDVIDCEDRGPATKLIPALAELPADQRLLVVDDDRVYPPDMLEVLQARTDASPDVAWGLSGWSVPDDLIDRPTTLISNVFQIAPTPFKCSRLGEPRRCDVLQGFSGFVVRPRFFDLEKVTDYDCAPPQAVWVDDVWLSAHCLVPKFVLPYRRFPSSYWRHARFYAATGLGRLNRGDGDPRTRSNSVVIRHLADRWLVRSKPMDRANTS